MRASTSRRAAALLTIEWAGDGAPVLMTGPAVTVFEGEIEVPDPEAMKFNHEAP